jgi:transcriptional regulator with XRE-family HTH domain
MKGSDLKDLLRREGVILSQLAEDLGMSQQNLSAAFTRDDVKSGFLEKIAAALNKPIGFFYGERVGSVQTVGDNNSQVTQVAGNYSGAPDSDVLGLLKIKDEQLLLTIKQVSKAQEQMDRVLDRFCGALSSDDPKGV